MQIISNAVQEWDSAFISFTKSCKHLYESRKENNLLVDVQPCFSFPILNELIETRLSISMKLAVGKYQEKSFDARDKFNHSTDHLFSALNSFAEAVINHYVPNSRLSKVVSIQNILNKLSGNRRKPERPVKSKEGKVITNIGEQQNRWVEHFKELLNRPALLNPPNIEAAPTDLPINVGPPTIEEIS
ncbi:unnamed protein product, partial [Schistosoma curassoni]|uniref:Uncharacterized protein n=1 Tax=Schistosoma curassoni TaxID=6186 RepID=A0A183KIN4_9TREM